MEKFFAGLQHVDHLPVIKDLNQLLRKKSEYSNEALQPEDFQHDPIQHNKQYTTTCTTTTTCSSTSSSKNQVRVFCIDQISQDDKLMQYYTGFSYNTFNKIYKFLVPLEDTIMPPINNITTKAMNYKNQLFLTFCKLRNNFDLQDLCFRFGITKQSAGVIFSTWINFMFLRFGEVPIWPHRDVIAQHMPKKYSEEFPSTFAILDCTEIKIQKPSSLKAQSQTYSDYKSANTVKALVAIDPKGFLLFASMLFAGSMSDHEIFRKSGLKYLLGKLIEIDYLKRGDGLMVDKGFKIEDDINELGLNLNIPPFARQGTQMSKTDALFTKKIAAHRVHVERAISRIKKFKILSNQIHLGQE